MNAYLVCDECGIRDLPLDTECCERCGKKLWLDNDESETEEIEEIYELYEPEQYPDEYDDDTYINVEH